MSDIPRTRRQRTHATAAEAVPGKPDIISSAPAVWSAPRQASQRAPSGQLGWDSARPSLEAGPGAIRPLETSGSVLPELDESSPEVRRRPMWRHPASLVSIGTTLLALIAMGVFLVLGAFGSSPAASDLRLESTENVVRASWSGPDVPYQVIVIDSPAGAEIDVSQQVTGTEIWLPRAAELVSDASCLIVRPAEGNEEAPASLDHSTLEAQGAVAGCVADAPSE